MMIVALVDRLINSKVFNQLQPFIQLYQVCWDSVESRPVDRGPLIILPDAECGRTRGVGWGVALMHAALDRQ
jgi:translation initiation factor 2 beta subunit (eIF-2beta)/eIF-5